MQHVFDLICLDSLALTVDVRRIQGLYLLLAFSLLLFYEFALLETLTLSLDLSSLSPNACDINHDLIQKDLITVPSSLVVNTKEIGKHTLTQF